MVSTGTKVVLSVGLLNIPTTNVNGYDVLSARASNESCIVFIGKVTGSKGGKTAIWSSYVPAVV